MVYFDQLPITCKVEVQNNANVLSECQNTVNEKKTQITTKYNEGLRMILTFCDPNNITPGAHKMRRGYVALTRVSETECVCKCLSCDPLNSSANADSFVLVQVPIVNIARSLARTWKSYITLY